MCELLDTPPWVLCGAGMLATTLGMRCVSTGALLVVTTGRATYAAHHAAGDAVLTGRELCVLALGAEDGRAAAAALACWLEAGGPHGNPPQVESVAYGGAYALQTPSHRWPLGHVLDAWGLVLEHVAVGDGPAAEWLA